MKSAKKNLWGIGIWGFALAVFYLTVGIVAVYVLLDQIAHAINASATLFDEWYQILLFVLDLLCFGGLVASVVLYVLARRKDRSRNKTAGGGAFYSVFDRTTWGGVTAFFAVLMIIVLVGSSFAYKYAGNINDVFGISLFKKIQLADDELDTNYFPSDYYYSDGSFNDQAMRAHSEEVSERAANESTVLLWNNGDALPLPKDSKVGVFGITQQTGKYFYTGTGSGKLSPLVQRGLTDELIDKGLKVYSSLSSAYRMNGNYGPFGVNATQAGVDDANYSEWRINDVPWSALNGTSLGNVTDNTAQYEDAAIYLISRYGGETLDVDFDEGESAYRSDECFDGNYLDLSKNEADVLEHLKDLKAQKKIKRIILLINSDNAVQFKNIVNYDIDACLWVGMGGNASFKQIANALTGKSNPSGRLVDTFVYDNYSAPAMENFGDFTFTEHSGLAPTEKYTWNTKYVVYQEGIYVGYKYYETRYEDAVIGGRNATSAKGVKAGSGSWNYNDEVAFTFGYGLSYTDFEYSNFKVAKNDKNKTFDISVNVKNIGTIYSGKETVQIYLQRPYTDYDKEHGIEKSAVDLVGFAKTDELAPGASMPVTVSVKQEELKCYDSYNEKTYILENGDYYLAAGKNAHDALNNILALKGYDTKSGMDANGNRSLAYKYTVSERDSDVYRHTSQTGREVTNLFDNADINLYDGTSDQSVVYLSRSDWDETYPTPYSMKCTNPVMIEDMKYGKEPEIKEGDEFPVYGVTSEKYGPIVLASMMDVDYYNEEMWNAFMDQTTWEEQVLLVTYGAHAIAGAESVAAPGGFNQNGPSGLNQPNPTLGTMFAFPSEVNLASTFNVALTEEVGDAFGMEMLHTGYTSLNGLGADIHRSAYSGRNWEYYSEDPYMTGVMLAAESAGLQNRGIILFTKHCLMNDQERNRYGVTTWANEQTIREIYAKGFEIAVTEADLNGIMSSFNRIGCTWSGRHEGLLTKLLRDEWGFHGSIETDAAVGRHMVDSVAMANAVVAGQDLWLMGGMANGFANYKEGGSKANPTVALAVREAARRILYSQLHANAMNGTGTNTRYIPNTPWWQIALECVKAVVITLFAASAIYLITAIVVNMRWFRRLCGDDDAEVDVEVEVHTYGENESVVVPERSAAAVAAAPAKKQYSGKNKFVAWVKRYDVRKFSISVSAIALAVVMVIVTIVVPVRLSAPAPLPNFGGSGTSGGGTDIPAVHECSHKCPVCGKCVDLDCDDEICVEKCGADKAHKYVFEAENVKNTLAPGSMGNISRLERTDSVTKQPVGLLGNFSGNNGASVTFSIYSETAQTASLIAKVSGGSTGAYKFTDCILLSVNGGDAIDRPTIVSQSTTGDWFNFVEFDLGCVELEAGENTVRLMSTGTSSNIDYIAFKSDSEITYADGSKADIVDGEVTPIEPIKPNPGMESINENIDDSAWTVYEHFDAVDDNNRLVDGVQVSSLVNVTTTRTNARGKNCVGNLDGGKGKYVTFKIHSDKTEKVGLYMELGKLKDPNTLEDWCYITVNGTNYTSDAEMPSGENYIPSNEYVRIGFVTLNEGDNTVTFTVNTTQTFTAHNIYGLKFTAQTAVISWAEKEEPPAPVDPDDSEWTGYAFDSTVKNADNSYSFASGVEASVSSMPANRANEKGVVPIGGLNQNAGAYVQFTVNSDKEETVGLYGEFCYGTGNNLFSDWAMLTVNGKECDSSAVMPEGADWTPSNTYIKLAFVKLGVGSNTIRITVKTKDRRAFNIYGLKFTAETAHITEYVPPVIENINVATDDSAWTVYEHFDAVNTAGDAFVDGVKVDSPFNIGSRLNDRNIKCVGNLDRAKGKSLTFYINSDKAEKVGLYLELGELAKVNKFSDWCDLTVNGTNYTSDADMPAGTNYIASNKYVCIGFVTLQAGNNVITFTVNSDQPTTAHNFYGLKFTAQSAVITWGVKTE